jgi:hypothetical protein
MGFPYFGVKMIERLVHNEDLAKIKEQQKFAKKRFEDLTLVEKDELLKQIAKKLNLVR